MKAYRFYEEFKDKRKDQPTGNVFALYLPEQDGVTDSTLLLEYRVCPCGVGAIFERPDSPVSGMNVCFEYLRTDCKRISEHKAREIHPNLFAYLDNLGQEGVDAMENCRNLEPDSVYEAPDESERLRSPIAQETTWIHRNEDGSFDVCAYRGAEEVTLCNSYSPLYAAAPDLLAACRAALSLLQFGGSYAANPERHEEVMEMLYTAIRKGEEG